MDSVKDVLKAIGETTRIRERIQKENARATGTKAVVEHPDDILLFDVFAGDSKEAHVWKNFHVKCKESGISAFGEQYTGYTFIQTKRLAFDDLYCSRTICHHCGKQLNPALTKKLTELHEANRVKKHNDWLSEAKKREDKRLIELELLKEQAMLGLI